MTAIYTEGWDEYGPIGFSGGSAFPSYVTLMEAAGWIFNFNANVTIGPSLNGLSGNSLNFGVVSASFGQIANRGLGANYNVLIGGFRFQSPLFSDAGIVFADGATTQLSIVIKTGTGLITVQQGDNGTVLATSVVNVATNTIHYLEFQVTFNHVNTMGGWTVWLDGVEILSGTGTTSLSGNNWANFVGLRCYSSGSSNFTVDDFYLFDNTTSFNNQPLLSNPFVLTQSPIGDYSIQFPNIGNVVGFYYTVNNNQVTISGNHMYLIPFTPNVACQLNAVVIGHSFTNAPLAQYKALLYADNGSNAPGTLIAAGVLVVGIAAGQATLDFSASQALSAGTQYWLGFMTDTTTGPSAFNDTSFVSWQAANTFSSGAPSTAPTGSSGQQSCYVFGLCTGATQNWETQALNPPIGDQSSIASASVGVSDLYTFPAVPTNITTIYDVAVEGYARLNYAGTHTFGMITQSGTVVSGGSNPTLVPTINYGYFESHFDTDPATSVAWTPAGLSSAHHGQSVDS